jgi:hypothetical protein
LLNYLHKKSLTGVDAVKYAFQRLLFHCHKVFFNQVSSWLVHGLITDPFHEFFVQRIKGAPGLDIHRNKDEDKNSNIAVPSHDWN